MYPHGRKLFGFIVVAVGCVGYVFYDASAVRLGSDSVSDKLPSYIEDPSPSAQLSKESTLSVSENHSVRVEHDRLSLNVNDVPLQVLLRELSRATGVPIFNALGARAPLISAELRDVPFEAGLRELLPTLDVLFLYGSDNQRTSALRAVWVLPAGTGKQAIVMDDPMPTPKSQDVSAASPLEGQNDERLIHALQDSRAEVRLQALAETVVSTTILPIPVLQDLSRTDPAAEVRMAALLELARSANDRQAVRVAAEFAVNDPDLSVQSTAQEMLQTVDALDRGADELPLLTTGVNAEDMAVPLDLTYPLP